MKILFLGPPCERMEKHLQNTGHSIIRIDDTFNIEFLQEQNIDFGISYNYSKIIRRPVIDWFRGKLINLHISYLPWNRGSYPNMWSYIDDTPRGVTIHCIDEGIDTGSIILQKTVDIDIELDTLYTSWCKLSEAIEDLFIRNSERILYEKITPYPQLTINTKTHGRTISGGSSATYPQLTINTKTHGIKDTAPYFVLIEEDKWNTPLKVLLSKLAISPPPL